jgi:gamma-glutamyl-gamma-aminobutyrate hydrolase PuuD
LHQPYHQENPLKLLGITQRVAAIKDYGERRDCLDQRWSDLALCLNYLPVALPNISPEKVESLVDSIGLDAIVFSGGNTIASLDLLAADTAPERDAFESELLKLALVKDIPVIGICRGMQMINLAFGGDLTQISGHVATPHLIYSKTLTYQFPKTVNSYHRWGISNDGLANDLVIMAIDAEGHIEAYEHQNARLLGLMWHPEREKPFNPLDIKLLTRFLE